MAPPGWLLAGSVRRLREWICRSAEVCRGVIRGRNARPNTDRQPTDDGHRPWMLSGSRPRGRYGRPAKR